MEGLNTANIGLSEILNGWKTRMTGRCPDTAFREDECRIRKGFASSENLAIALNLLKKRKALRNGLNAKRLLSGWDNDYLSKVLQMEFHN